MLSGDDDFDNFEWLVYLNNYEDLRNAGINTKEKAFQHYKIHGKNEGRVTLDITKKFDWEKYGDDESSLINKISLGSYKFLKRRICIIHICNINNAYHILIEQINRIKSSGLYHELDYIFISLIGVKIYIPLDSKIKLVYYSPNNHEWEFPSVKIVKYISDLYPENLKILSIHTKGAMNKQHAYEWRKYLEFFVIDNYEKCLNLLDNYVAVGVNQYFYFDKINGQRNLFDGNFWWANSFYIKSLPHFRRSYDRYYPEHYLIGNMFKLDNRYTFSFHHTDRSLYEYSIQPQEYNTDVIKYDLIETLKNSFVKEKKIYGVFFIACIGDYYSIVENQLNQLMKSGLYDVTNLILCFITCYSDEISQLLSKYDKIIVIKTTENKYEKFALNNYKKYLDGDYLMYYIHSKSVTQKEKCYKDWLALCNYFTINKWRLSVELLKYYDCVGVNMLQFPKLHYSGNFWWSKSSHLNKLGDIGSKYLSPEMYILSYMKTNKICIFSSGVTHGNTEFDECNYNMLTDDQIIANISMIPTFNRNEKQNIINCDTYDDEHILPDNLLNVEFDYLSYLRYNSDLYPNGITTESMTLDHWNRHGKFEGRTYSYSVKEKLIILIGHEDANTGAPIFLRNLQAFYLSHGLNVELFFLNDIKDTNFNAYIIKKSQNYQPIIIGNTLCCSKILNLIPNHFQRILIIHEWLDNNNYFDFIYEHRSIFSSNVLKVFLGYNHYNNYKSIFRELNDKYFILNNWFSKDHLTKMRDKNTVTVNRDHSDIFIGIIGTIERRKNQQNFINNVFSKIVVKYPNVKLLLVGKISEELNIPEEFSTKIIMTGSLDNAIPYINFCDIIVSYSINEVFPLNILESFFCCKPVISTNVGCVNEIIEDEYNGFLIENNDSETCFEKLSLLIEDEELRISMGSNSGRTFCNKFELETRANKIFSLLNM